MTGLMHSALLLGQGVTLTVKDGALWEDAALWEGASGLSQYPLPAPGSLVSQGLSQGALPLPS